MRHFGISLVVFYALATFTACGSQDGAHPPQAQSPDADGEAGGPSDPGRPGSEAGPLGEAQAPAGQASGQPAYYLATLDELPSCDDEHRRWLAYVAEASAFYHCALDGWQVVELKGKDGKDGASGRDGTAVDNTWRDPATGRVWLFGSSVLQYQAYGAAEHGYGCAKGYRMPTHAEALEAWRDGLAVAASALAGGASTGTMAFWIVPRDASKDREAYNALESAYTGAAYRAGLICYREGQQ